MPVIAAVDRSDFGHRVGAEAAELAAAFDVDLHVVHVLSRTEFLELEQTQVQASGRGVGMEQVREMAANVAAEKAEGIDYPFEVVGLMGEPAQEIVRYSDEADADYIVIGGRKRTPVGKVLFGSVAQSILLRAKRPVLTVMEGRNE